MVRIIILVSKNSVLLNEPYKFDGNLILATSTAQDVKKGYKTAGTSISNKKNQNMFNSKQKHDYYATTNYYSEKGHYEPGLMPRKIHKNDTLEEAHFDPKRDISPYRVENFVDMLHQFGVSDTTIKQKLVNSPIRHNKYPHDEGDESINQTSMIRNRKARLPTIKSTDENTANNSRVLQNNTQCEVADPMEGGDPQNEVLLPDLNNSRSSLKSKATRKSIKNRRNISTKKSQDNPNFSNYGQSMSNREVMVAQNMNVDGSPSKVVGLHNIDTTIAEPNMLVNPKIKFQPHVNEGQSPAYNHIESPSYASKHIKTESDYYGSYAKIAD